MNEGKAFPWSVTAEARVWRVHFHGLQQYSEIEPVLNDGAIQRHAILDEFLEKWDGMMKLVRLDRSIDFIGLKWCDYSNSREHRKLCKRHGTAVFKRTTVYYQPPKPKYVKVTGYDKQRANGLAYPSTRIEISFMSQYWAKSIPKTPAEMMKAAMTKTDASLKRLFR